MKATYDIPGTLEESLHVINEIMTITGMTPIEIRTNENKPIRFNTADFKKIQRGEVSVQNYIDKNTYNS